MSASLALGAAAPARSVPARRRTSFSPFDPETPHLRFAVVSILVLWLFVLTAIQVLPRHYVSKATLIIPGATTAVNVALDKIGQASSAPVSAYNTGHISPKVIYKEMAQSDDVRAEAARALGISPREFGAPRIKLVDETPLVHIEMRHGDPETAWQQAQALIAALQARLDRLRNDELSRRTATVLRNLDEYEHSLLQARAKVAALQAASGLQSLAQFNEFSASLVQRGRRLAELESELARLEREQSTLAQRLGVEPALAAVALATMADPTLAKAISDYADATAALGAELRRLGPENPQLLLLQKRQASAAALLDTATARRGVSDPAMREILVLLTNSSHQAELYKRLVANEAMLDGRRVEFVTTTRELRLLEAEHARLGRAAAEFEDLKKQLTVAEAVYATAKARIETTKSDVYGSYPLLQTLASPSRPTSPGGAQGLLALAGGVLGTLLLALAWFLAWLRTASPLRLSRSA